MHFDSHVNSDVLDHSIGKILRPFPLSRKYSLLAINLGEKRMAYPLHKVVWSGHSTWLFSCCSVAQLVSALPMLYLHD